MEPDDPNKPEFASWRSYYNFAQRVRQKRRYVWDAYVNAFLSTVLATNKNRDVTLSEGKILYRAQRGIEDGTADGGELTGYNPTRMKPQPNRAIEGRVNPAGIPVLYLGTTEQTSISEVRPWIGAEVSVAQFKIVRNVKAIDLSLGHGKSAWKQLMLEHLLGDEPDAETKKKAVWINIDNAFSCPVTVADDGADYVPTQILSELFRSEGYDAIVYKSQFGERGYNVALFNVDDANPINCAPYEVTAIEVKAREIGNRWFLRNPVTSA